MLQSAASENEFAIREDRRSEEAVKEVGVGKLLRFTSQFPSFLASGSIESVNPTADIDEVNGLADDEGGSKDAIG